MVHPKSPGSPGQGGALSRGLWSTLDGFAEARLKNGFRHAKDAVTLGQELAAAPARLESAAKRLLGRPAEPPAPAAKLLNKPETVLEKRSKLFHEDREFSAEDLEPASLKLSPRQTERLTGGHESGLAGRILAATFINRPHRWDGDFSRAYGEEAWRGYVRAHQHLAKIPSDRFLDELTPELCATVNGLVFAADTGRRAEVNRRTAAMVRGHLDRPGTFRSKAVPSKPYWQTQEEVKNLEGAGLTFKDLPGSTRFRRYGSIVYPEVGDAKAALGKLIDALTSAVKAEDADVVGAAADFCRGFVALHPFEECNGRTARLLMNHVLRAHGFPPVIFVDQDNDLALSPEAYRKEVRAGVARTKEVLSESPGFESDRFLTKQGLATHYASYHQPVELGGMPFDLGADGFLYDLMGRPHVVADGRVEPLGQLDHYLFGRRLMALDEEKAKELLEAMTEATRDLYHEVKAKTKDGAVVEVASDAAARAADAEYRPSGSKAAATLLAGVAKVSALDPETLFVVEHARGTPVSSLMSKYAQHDLDLWAIERGLRVGGHGALADGVHREREALFAKARRGLAERLGEEPGPRAFSFEYERRMYEHSPLRHASLSAAIAADGDDDTVVYRGDYAVVELLGMNPGNDPTDPPARELGRQRFDGVAGTPLLLSDLSKLEGSGVGSPYLSLTTDLALLSAAFASAKKTTEVDLSSLPNEVGGKLTGLLPGAKRPWDPGLYGGKALGQAAERLVGLLGEYVDVAPKDGGKVALTSQRRAYTVKLPKSELLPGMQALGKNDAFPYEQEVHGLGYIAPWRLLDSATADALKVRLRPEAPPAPKPEPDPSALLDLDLDGVSFADEDEAPAAVVTADAPAPVAAPVVLTPTETPPPSDGGTHP